MKKQINPTIKAHLLRGAFYLLLLLAVCVIPFALAQRNTGSKNAASKKAAGQNVTIGPANRVAPATTTLGPNDPRRKGESKSASSTLFSHARGTVPRPVVNAPAGTACWYDFTVGTDTFVPGVDDIGSHCDDCDTPITIPFSVTLYGQSFTTAQAGSNGHLTFGVDNPSFVITCPPPFGINETTEALAPYWGDQCTGACAGATCSTCGIFTTTTGSAPNRIFYIEWRTQYYNQAQTLNYEIALYESGDPPFKFIYNTITPAGAPNDSQLVVGQKFDETCYTVFGCDTSGGQSPPVSSGQALTAIAAPTPTPTPPPQCSPWATASPYPLGIVRYGFVQTATDFYVFGGVSDGTRVNNVNRYNIATGMWTALSPMPFTSEAPTCALMEATGIVYCAEGDTGSGFASYNIATDTWTPLASDPFVTDNYGSASGAFNGKVFVAGGTASETNAVRVYDVAGNSWSSGTAAPSIFLLAGYQQVGQFLYVIGGWDLGSPGANKTTSYRLDMSSALGVWDTGPAFTQARSDFGLAYDASTNKLYAMGGDPSGGGFFDSSNLVDELCLEGWPGGVWSSSTPNLPSPTRQANQAGFYGGGNIWSVGGLNGSTFTFLPDVLWRPSCAAACATASPTPTPTPTPTGSPIGGSALWYNGDFDGRNGGANQFEGQFGSGFFSDIYDNFTGPASGQWTVTGVFSNNIMDPGLNTAITTANWSIRTGVSEGNGGTVVASATNAPATVTPTGRSGFGRTEYQVMVTGLSVTLNALPAGQFYFLDVVPVVPIGVTGQSFCTTTSGANCVGTPCGNDGNSWWDSNLFVVTFTSTTAIYGPGTWDQSMGVIGTVGGGSPTPTATATATIPPRPTPTPRPRPTPPPRP